MSEIQNEEILLRSVPDNFILSFDGMEFLKAVDAGSNKRDVYFKASDESLDMQNDSVMMSALVRSKDYFLQKGNIDYGHYSKLPYQSLIGIVPERDADVRVPRMFELGLPKEVVFDKEANGTFVKGTIYENGKLPDWFWSTLQYNPPMRWFPSIGGATLQKSIEVNGSGKKIAKIKEVRWSNIGMTQEPINTNGVQNVTTMPIGTFFKSFENGISMEKAMESSSVAPLMKEDLEGKAGSSYSEIRKNPKKFRPILKSWLCKKYKVSEEDAEKHLEKIFN